MKDKIKLLSWKQENFMQVQWQPQRQIIEGMKQKSSYKALLIEL